MAELPTLEQTDSLTLQQAAAAHGIDPAYAQRQMLEQEEAQFRAQQEAYAQHAQASAQKAATLKHQEAGLNKGSAMGAGAAAVAGAGLAYKTTQVAGSVAGRIASPEALQKEATAFLKEKATKIDKIDKGFFGMFKPNAEQVAKKAQKIKDEAFKQAEAKFGSSSKLTELMKGEVNGLNAMNAKPLINHYNGQGAEQLEKAAIETIEHNNPKWVRDTAAKGLEVWEKHIPCGKIGKAAALGTIVLGTGLAAKALYDKSHESGQKTSDMLKEQIAAAEAEAHDSANKAQAVGGKWQQYLQAREAAPAMASGAQLG